MLLRLVLLLDAVTPGLLLLLPPDVRVPPSITRSPVELKIYRSDDEITLECLASGVPRPQFEWKKDGRLLGNPSNVDRVGEGGVQIKPLTSLDEGRYQCFASNSHGTALSRPTVLQRAVLSPSTPGTPIFESPPLQEGQPYTLVCNPSKCVPRPSYSWAVAKTTVDDTQQPVLLSKRVQIDDEGRLHFSYVTLADAQDGKLYKCNMYNPYLDTTMGGSYSRLNVVPVATLPLFAPTYLFSSPSPVVALEGRNVTLRCFFSGNPEPSLQWSRASGSLPIGRHQITNYNTELTIRDVQKSDEGDYYCRAANTQKQQEHLVHIRVQAVPMFRALTDRPHNVNVTEGDSVSVWCRAHAEPLPTVTWMINGAPLDPGRLPPRMRLGEGGLRLSLSDVCKDCPDLTSDLRVIQCNASNAHGYAFADGYINVLKRTLLVVRPTDVHTTHDSPAPALFECSAASDDSTPARLRWYRARGGEGGTRGGEGGGEAGGDELLYNTSNKLVLGEDGSLTITLAENSSDWLAYRGLYKCRADNGYSADEALALLDIDGPLALIPGARVSGARLADWWWIFVLLALLLLLLILLICCCICLQRNKGDSYPVDEKERRNGNNPDKECADNDFHHYQRPDSEGAFKGSGRGSLSSSMKLSTDDEGSLNEYGDIDAGKFTEDGSFIGDYGSERRGARGRDLHA